MQKRRLASTDIEVSVLGLGTVKFGRNQSVKYPNTFNLPSDEEVKKIVHQARDLGINLIDTAPAYGTSEERIGKLLMGQRSEWVIMSKVGEEFVNNFSSFDFSAQAVTQSINRSLQRLRTEYLDIVLVHSNGEDEKIIQDLEIFATLAALKKSGKIKTYGFSSKTVTGGLLSLQHTDCAMVTLNPNYADELPVIQYASAHNKGIFIKKAFASGHLNWSSPSSPVETSLRYIFSHAGVTSVIVGTINPVHLKQNVDALNKIIA